MRIYGCKNETQARTLVRVLARTMGLGGAKCYSVDRVDYSGECYKSKVVAWAVSWHPNAYITEWNKMRTKEEAKAGRAFIPFEISEDWQSKRLNELAGYCRGFDYAAKRTNNPGW